jgi:hypothetical protein
MLSSHALAVLSRYRQYFSIRLKECKNVNKNTANIVVASVITFIDLVIPEVKQDRSRLFPLLCTLGTSLFVTLDVSDEVQHIPSAPHVTSVQLTLLEQSLLFKFRRSNCGLFSVVLVFFTHVQFVLPYMVLERRFSSSFIASQSLVPS